MSHFVLVTGGARSGKSRFAELLAAQPGFPVTYVATAQVLDEEMATRVKKHRSTRPAHWSLIEESYEPGRALYTLPVGGESVVLLDCVTLWLSNLLLKYWPANQADNQNTLDEGLQAEIEATILAQVEKLANTAQEIPSRVIFVTNEVGQGIVPERHLARFYRDLAGKSNQILAGRAEEVYLVVAGFPLEIKTSGSALLSRLNTKE